MASDSKPVVVVGDGWAALGAVGFLVTTGIEVVWIEGSSTRILPPIASLENGAGVEIWSELCRRVGLNLGQSQSGVFLKEYRGKAFRDPLWLKTPTVELRTESRNEILWDPERQWVGLFETRFELTLAEMEEGLRKFLRTQGLSNLLRIERVPFQEVQVQNSQVQGVVLGSGEVISCDQVIYADRWSILPEIAGLPKPLSFLRGREPVGILQACFTHEVPLGTLIPHSFFTALHKESGETVERHLWGYFVSDGTKSIWTLGLTSEEMEDNHQIAKKFRKLKSSLDRVFAGSDLVPPGKQSFMSTVVDEQVRFEENVIFSNGERMTEPASLNDLSGISFLTDGYGPTLAMQQVQALLGFELPQDPQPSPVDHLSENESKSEGEVKAVL